jgi:hypothetical protein
VYGGGKQRHGKNYALQQYNPQETILSVVFFFFGYVKMTYEGGDYAQYIDLD